MILHPGSNVSELTFLPFFKKKAFYQGVFKSIFENKILNPHNEKNLFQNKLCNMTCKADNSLIVGQVKTVDV